MSNPALRLPVLLDLKQVGEHLGVSPKTVARLIDAGHLVGHTIGRQRRISEDDLAIFIASRRTLIRERQ